MEPHFNPNQQTKDCIKISGIIITLTYPLVPGQAAGPGEVGGCHAGLAAGGHGLALLDLLTSADLRLGVTEASGEVTAAADWRGGRLAAGTRDARHSSRGRCCCCCGGGG